MAKQKKKRNKRYTGADAATARPSITKVQAVNRSKPGQWWHENKKRVKPIAITAAVVLVVVWLIIELVRAVSGGGA